MKYPTVFPALVYDDPSAAIDFLTSAFGAERHAVYGENGAVRHAELSLGNGLVMFSAARPDTQPAGGAAVYIVVSDPDAHCARAREAGAEIVREPHDSDYGSRNFSAKDPEGNVWHFGTYQPFEASSASAAATFSSEATEVPA
jgi:uncharacterized glyoxalase superfamily protein PhnB